MVAAVAAVVALLPIIWYASGRDAKTFRDGLSRSFRDRGDTALSTILRLAKDQNFYEPVNKVLLASAQETLLEAGRNVKTRSDSTVLQLLRSFLVDSLRTKRASWYMDEDIRRFKTQMEEIDRLPTTDALHRLHALDADHKTQKAAFDAASQEMDRALENAATCGLAAARYFEEPISPSEGLTKLCQIWSENALSDEIRKMAEASLTSK